MKIATILPYKENYTFSKAQAAAIWVSDFYKNSKFRDNNFIFGNTNTKDFLTKNYVNIRISNLKSKFTSTTKEYCNNFIKYAINKNGTVSIHLPPPYDSFMPFLLSNILLCSSEIFSSDTNKDGSESSNMSGETNSVPEYRGCTCLIAPEVAESGAGSPLAHPAIKKIAISSMVSFMCIL